jgi:hypothetical protein
MQQLDVTKANAARARGGAAEVISNNTKQDEFTSSRHIAQDPAVNIEWHQELQRRLARAEALVHLGLPDPGFDLLQFEIMRYRARREVRA